MENLQKQLLKEVINLVASFRRAIDFHFSLPKQKSDKDAKVWILGLFWATPIFFSLYFFTLAVISLIKYMSFHY